MSLSEVREQAMRMSPEDRALLADELYQSVHALRDQKAIDDAWSAEADRRLKEYEAGGLVDSVDAFEHIRQLRNEITQRRLQK